MQAARHLPTLLLISLSVPALVACLPASDAQARAGSLRATHRLSYKTNSSRSCSRSFAITRHSGSNRRSNLCSADIAADVPRH